uniref:Uncharacterized protein n=1 Tax=Chlamydomonas leiostraca TaxID=1034604 RepID=A0A7S0RM06_9CHLO|mmetsp:Transcript_26479/g.67323  ORF Transcript_26479/g.67323 Transcript_26479/m.67323 type:complete len:139 (+) Transcript_26479:200-616(+)
MARKDAIAKDSAQSLMSTPEDRAKHECSPQDASCSRPRPHIGGRFRAVVNLVLALRRWQHALNPTISFKRPEEEESKTGMPPAPVVPSRLYTGRTMSGRLVADRTASGRPLVAGVHHGHKAQILFRQLPEVAVAPDSR